MPLWIGRISSLFSLLLLSSLLTACGESTPPPETDPEYDREMFVSPDSRGFQTAPTNSSNTNQLPSQNQWANLGSNSGLTGLNPSGQSLDSLLNLLSSYGVPPEVLEQIKNLDPNSLNSLIAQIPGQTSTGSAQTQMTSLLQQLGNLLPANWIRLADGRVINQQELEKLITGK